MGAARDHHLSTPDYFDSLVDPLEIFGVWRLEVLRTLLYVTHDQLFVFHDDFPVCWHMGS